MKPIEHSVAPTGNLALTVIRGNGTHVVDPYPEWPMQELTLATIIEHALPKRGLPDEVNEFRARNLRDFMRGFRRWAPSRALRLPTHYGALWLTKITGDGQVLPLGLASLRVVTTAGVNKLVACMNTTDAATFPAFKFHGFGTGTTAEAIGDTTLVTELTTQYNPDSTRPTGSQTVGGSNNIYRTVGTLTPDSGGTIAVTEHGIFSAASAGTLWDRTKFSAVNLDSTAGDSLQTTYDCTFPAGS